MECFYIGSKFASLYVTSLFLGHPQAHILYQPDTVAAYRSLPVGQLAIANTPGGYSSVTTSNSVSRYQQPLSHLSGPGSFQYVATPQSSYQASSPLHTRPALAYGQYTPIQVIQQSIQVPATYLPSRHMQVGELGSVVTTSGTSGYTNQPPDAYSSPHRQWNPSTYP